MKMAKDPYKYFRIEARELMDGLTRDLLDLEKGALTPELTARLLRAMHTLKGASRVVRQTRISELAHKLEDLLTPFRDGKTPIPRACIDEMLQLLDGVAAQISSLDTPRESETAIAQPHAAPASSASPAESIRVDVGEMDKLLEGIAEIGTKLVSMQRDTAGLDRAKQLSVAIFEHLARPRAAGASASEHASQSRLTKAADELRTLLMGLQDRLAEDGRQAGVLLSQVRDAANRVRLLPAEVIFSSLERSTRDAAQALKKKVRFEAAGGDTRLDAHVLAAIRDALLHLVRNAVAHGIEQESQRKALGKPVEGLVRLNVERRGGNVAFACRDDGAGIDVAAVRQAVMRRGLLPPGQAEQLGVDELTQILLRGGVTTTETLTEVSGRGVGLDAVRAIASRLKGTISIRTQRETGTTVEIVVPVSLASVDALRMEAAGITVAIPLKAVKEVLRIEDRELARSGNGKAIVRGDRTVPFLHLSELFGGTEKLAGAVQRRSAVVVETDAGAAALGVERLLGVSTAVVRSLPATLRAEAFVAGASSDLEGIPELVLEPANLVRAIREKQGVLQTAPVRVPLPVLVIDDSLTTRMLEQSILESAGYEVELATSAEEGLEKARSRKFGLIVVDVEMPGMNGFEFLERVKADPALAGIPSILVTSRAAQADRSRGQQAGARAYIVKSEFDQNFLLQTIRSLIG